MISLEPGRDYTWDELGALFDFDPDYLGAVGGMVSRPQQDALLLMTHPGGARSIDYGDYWDGDDLIYTGRGKYGDQQRTGQNRDLGENSKTNYVFEPSGSRMLRFIGQARAVDEWTALHPDANGRDRSVLRFRLQFEGPPASADRDPSDAPESPEVERRPRPFDPAAAPTPPGPAASARSAEETQALHEKAVSGHHALLVHLAAWLADHGWSDIEEIPLAVDLWARMPGTAARVIFEAKTVRAGSEGPRVRAAIAQLLEYRFFYGELDDRLCLVCDQPIADRRTRLLDALDIAVIWWDGEGFESGSATSGELVTG